MSFGAFRGHPSPDRLAARLELEWREHNRRQQERKFAFENGLPIKLTVDEENEERERYYRMSFWR